MNSQIVEQTGVTMWIEIFRTGTFIDSNGRRHSFAENDLERIAQQYNERVGDNPSYEAPLVKGHPKDDAPAYGWVERLARRGQQLFAKLKSVSSEIVDEIKAGKYRRVSISMYPDLVLRHIGLLGAESPAVKGLRPISFVNLDESLAFEYSADTIDFAELRQEIRRLELENSQLSRHNETLQTQLRKLHNESLAQSFREFIRKVNQSNEYMIIPPSKEEAFVELLHFCAKADEQLKMNTDAGLPEGFSFVERVKQFVSELKPVPIRQEYTIARSDSISFENEFEGKRVLEDRMNLHIRAKQIQKENPLLSYEQALIMANKE